MSLVRGVLLCLALVACPATAAAQTIVRGSPLTAPNNTAFGCESSIQQDFVSGLFLATPMGHPSCTWWSSGIASLVADPNTGFVPATGTVTNVRVKSGPNPAPLRIVQLRSTAGCCVGVRESPTFQPTPNAVSQVTVNWAVEVVRDSVVGVSTNDIIGFSAVGGTGTLPISDQGLATHTPSAAFSPGVHTGTMTVPNVNPGAAVPVNYRAAIGYEPLLQYDFVPCPDTNRPVSRQVGTGCPSVPQVAAPSGSAPPALPPTPTPIVTSQPPARPAIDLRSTVARLRNGRIPLRVACQSTTPCLGRLLIRTAAKRPRLISSTALAIPAGTTKTIVSRIGRSQRRVLSRRASTPLIVQLALGKSAPITKKLTFRR